MLQVDLGMGVRRGLVWSSLNAVVLRIGTFAMGIFLARILAPEEFGVFAIALTVQAVLMTLADFGLSTDLIRSKNHQAKSPTVGTLGLIMGTLLFVLMWSSSQATANLLGSPEAGPVIAVMSGSLLLAGLGVVPYAKLQRDFQQKRLFGISLLDFVVVNTLTVVLVLLGWGVISLAIARLAAQFATLIAQFVLAGVKPRFGFNRVLAPEVISFGLPVAGANMLSWILLNVDNIAISSMAGPVSLGFYYLAFNVSNWPMSMLGQVVRSISLPAFARVVGGQKDRSLALALGPVWAVALFAGFMLSTLSEPLVRVVYGERWLLSAGILAFLGVFGALRMIFDLFVSYMLAKGHSTRVLIVQAIWIVGLVPSLVLLVRQQGALGAGLAHVIVSTCLVLPAYLVVLHRSQADIRLILRNLVTPAVAAVPAVCAAYLVGTAVDADLMKLFLGGMAGSVVYACAIFRWFRARMHDLTNYAGQVGQVGGDVPEFAPNDTATASRGEKGGTA
ncbi:lipopolysaccharide biosynthesis protein [Paeniglutamicibacter sp. ABSL32-1]|uniref:lipopolysaccharide biosynthesis protein n=1 Tax=Paeniglutamicibacter quisquiliarum TaxID=2849498 RepID=UPI001C2D514E|nr:lipopolysaccharide biosynthesis protein [Paeniglutamicibacter quisquiliarum]MBV1779204.1 lipopolysaccharide biosynthesis protein [Paeniglutamicibacter quisquiliarum]